MNAIDKLSHMFKFRWISGEPPLSTPPVVAQSCCSGSNSSSQPGMNFDDYEEQVLARLHKAQQRKVDTNRDNEQLEKD